MVPARMIVLPQPAQRRTRNLSGLVGLACPLRPFLVGRLFLPALVAHDALAFGIARLGSLVVARLAPNALFRGHFLIPLRSGDSTQRRPESSGRATKNQAGPVATAVRLSRLMTSQTRRTPQ